MGPVIYPLTELLWLLFKTRLGGWGVVFKAIAITQVRDDYGLHQTGTAEVIRSGENPVDISVIDPWGPRWKWQDLTLDEKM